MVSLIVGATFLGIMLLWMSIRLISFYCMVSKVKKLNLYPDKANAFFKKPNIVIYRNNLLNLLLFTPIVLISLTVGIYLNLSKEIKFDIINISMIALLSLTVILNILFIVIQLIGWKLINNNNVNFQKVNTLNVYLKKLIITKNKEDKKECCSFFKKTLDKYSNVSRYTTSLNVTKNIAVTRILIATFKMFIKVNKKHLIILNSKNEEVTLLNIKNLFNKYL